VTTHWRFQHAGRTLGPYPWPLLVQLHGRGSLPDTTLVQPAEGGPWMPLGTALAAQAVAPAAAPAGGPAETPDAVQARRFRRDFLLLYLLPLLLLVCAFYWVIHSVRDDIDPRPWWLALAVITLLMPLWYGFGSLWLWSAGGGAGQRLLSRAAMLLLGLLLLAMLGINYRPLKALVGIASSPDPYGEFSIAFENGGHTLVYSGPLGYAAPASLHAALARHRDVDTVVLDSVGGWMVSGRGIARVLRQARIQTVVARHRCASACVLAFESAPLRVLEEEAVLGFHSESNQFSWAASDGANDSFVEVFAARGVPQEFTDKAIATPPTALWRPGMAELFRNHLIDRVRLDGRDLGAEEYFPAVVDRYFAAPDFAPLAQGLREFAPEHLRKLHDEIAALLAQGAMGERIGAATLKAIDADEQLALQRAGDAAQLERAGLLRDLLADFSERAPRLCYAIWSGSDPAAVSAAFSPAQQRAYVQVMGDLLRSAAREPLPPPSDEDGAELMGRAVRPAYLKYGRLVFDLPAARQDGRVSDDAVCDMALGTFRQIQAMRPAEAGAAMRWLAHGRLPGGE
jgi:hypothetical protein